MKFHQRFGLLALLLSLGLSTVTPQVPPKREFRGAWIASVTNLDWPSSRSLSVQAQKDELVSMLDQLKANGISAIVFQVRPECDALYNSPYEPWSYWLTGTQGAPPNPYYDPLEFAVAETHKRGMEIHAWFNPYRAERVAGNYTTAPNHVTKAHPEWVLQISTLKFLDPGLPQVREYDARVIADVVRRYDIDGIHMDDYFYPYPPTQITNQDAATFAAYPRGFTDIGSWRRDNVNLLLRMLHDSVQVIKPFVKFGMSPFGIWKNGVPSGIVGMDAYSVIYCDAIQWLQDGSIDYLTPQLYWAIGGLQDYSKLMPWWSDSTGRYGRHFYPGQAAYRINDNNWAATELPGQVTLNRANPNVGGSVFFRANQGVNNNPKGFADSLRISYYRYPALHPVMAWKEVVPPYPPRAIRYDRRPGSSQWAIQWDLPNTAPDGDSASRYAVYRFDHRPSASELSDPRNLLSIEGNRWAVPPTPPFAGNPVYYAVTALDRNYNESDTSNILVIAPPAPPLLASPADGTTSLLDSVIVRWRPSEMAAAYHVQVSTDPTFASGLVVNDSTLTDTAKVVMGLAGVTTYSWRVRSYNAAGFGGYSAPFTFATGFPAAPLSIYPPAAATDIPVTPTFLWRSSSAASSYRLQVSRIANFSTMLVDSSGVTDTSVTAGPLDYLVIYFWRVRATNAIGSSGWSAPIRFRTQAAVSVSRDGGLPTEYALSQNYPNPFNPTTAIQFALPKTEFVTVRVYDMLGREETTLIEETLPAGRYTVTWNANRAASGVYFYRIAAGSFIATKRMLLLK